MSSSDVGYTVWYVVSIVFVIAILVVGMIRASGTKIRGHKKRQRNGT